MKWLLYSLVPIISLCMIGEAVQTNEKFNEHKKLRENDRWVDSFVANEGKNLGLKYNMHQMGIGGGSDHGTWLICLAFEHLAAPITQDEARKLIINCLNDLLTAINENVSIRPLLKNYPFTPENIELQIFCYTKDRGEIYHPAISTVTANQAKIGFFTDDPENSCKYKSKKYESYEEAVEILRNAATGEQTLK